MNATQNDFINIKMEIYNSFLGNLQEILRFSFSSDVNIIIIIKFIDDGLLNSEWTHYNNCHKSCGSFGSVLFIFSFK